MKVETKPFEVLVIKKGPEDAEFAREPLREHPWIAFRVIQGTASPGDQTIRVGAA